MDAEALTQVVRELQSAVESLTARVATLEATARPRSAPTPPPKTTSGESLIELPSTAAPLTSAVQPQKGIARALTSRFAR